MPTALIGDRIGDRPARLSMFAAKKPARGVEHQLRLIVALHGDVDNSGAIERREAGTVATDLGSIQMLADMAAWGRRRGSGRSVPSARTAMPCSGLPRSGSESGAGERQKRQP